MKLAGRGGRNAVSRSFYAREDKETIAAWKLDLDKVLRVFNVRSAALVMTIVNFLSPEDTSDNRRCSYF